MARHDGFAAPGGAKAPARRLGFCLGLDRLLRRAARDKSGAISIPLALIVPVLLGFAMLAIDGGRFFNLHTSLQSAADALALAGAAELDGRSDSITRANRAIDNLVGNDQRFGEGAGAIGRGQISVRFLKDIPASDATAIPAGSTTYETTDPTAARFLEVRVQPVAFQSFFAAAASVAGGPGGAAASAVAGFDSVACRITPLFMCNPFEGTSTSLQAGSRDPAFKRRQFAMKEKGNQYGPGNYGYLIPASGNGASDLKEALGGVNPRGCYLMRMGVDLRTGNVSSTAEAMNVRFDIYEGNYKNDYTNETYRPARNVRKAATGSGCNQSVAAYNPASPRGFPRDKCHENNTCATVWPEMAGRGGDGNWDFESYWDKNFGTARPIDPDTGKTYSNSNRPSRYAIYRYEIENNLTSRVGLGGTTGAPQCYKDTSTLSDTPDRRVFTGAILNCQALKNEMKGGSANDLPVEAYAKFFITEPVDKNEGTIWAEMIELVEPGTPTARDIIRDTVQLVR